MKEEELIIGELTLKRFDPWGATRLETVPGVVVIEDRLEKDFHVSMGNCIRTRAASIRAGAIGRVLLDRYGKVGPTFDDNLVYWYVPSPRVRRIYQSPKALSRYVRDMLGDLAKESWGKKLVKGDPCTFLYTHKESQQYFIIQGVYGDTNLLLPKLMHRKPNTKTKLGKFLTVFQEELTPECFSVTTYACSKDPIYYSNVIKRIVTARGSELCLSHSGGYDTPIVRVV